MIAFVCLPIAFVRLRGRSVVSAVGQGLFVMSSAVARAGSRLCVVGLVECCSRLFVFVRCRSFLSVVVCFVVRLRMPRLVHVCPWLCVFVVVFVCVRVRSVCVTAGCVRLVFVRGC